MGPLLFSADGVPRGQGRPRATARNGFATVYKDSASRKYEKAVAQLAKVAMGGRDPFEGPVSLSVRFRLAVPKSTPKWLRTKYLAGEEAYLGAFDTSNMVKSIEDAMNGIVFVDDRQIVRLFATKVADARPGFDVRVEPLG